MDPYLLRKLNTERAARRAVIHLTDLGDGRDRVIREGDPVAGPLGEAIARAFRSGRSGLVEVEDRKFFLNVHLPPARIVAIGAVHISQALARMAGVAGFDITIIDPRTAFATEERFAGIDLVADWPEDVLKARPLDAYTALVAVTHDPKIDDFPLSQALTTGCFYVGALGSRKTHAKRVERLTALGHGAAEIARISAPIGLDIGAASPAEIAVAILADIVAHLRRRPLLGAGP
ncbi:MULTISPECIES: XdhC family protein [unclassified Shinella]|uniref:XdhC family protein n=1 Tax=unclassified Shinella TaxID=2643062 RepID=UPI00225D436E|nr:MULTISPECIES: XdhC family protein [unclassified Shinella]MCO5140271.1 XdhC family protein [Shinella sp.]MDC7255010.1 XdhC family protein [Shinella sp. YE25]CAI0337765.1 Carbon monoxide dehydrogenase F protein [Rhizobiaceae bacterium]CAK7256239.1 xanthine dehydrogenase accessory factor [Shinella sp. WSC3-e]